MYDATKKQSLIGAIIAVIVGAIYYFLGGARKQQTQYADPQASGFPAQQIPGVVYNIGSPTPQPGPNLIYGAPPTLPQTPLYQSYNYPAGNILTLTPEAAQGVAAGGPPPTEAGCCCSGGNSQGQFGDGNLDVGLAANPSEQAASMTPTQLAQLEKNINTSALANDGFTWAQIANLVGAVPGQF